MQLISCRFSIVKEISIFEAAIQFTYIPRQPGRSQLTTPSSDESDSQCSVLLDLRCLTIESKAALEVFL